MSSPIRILVADASASLRRMIVAVAEAEDEMEICASAENGEDAVAQFRSSRPDIIVLNVNLSGMNCPEAVRAIRRLNPTLPIIIFSTTTVRGGEVTLKALSAGANDFVSQAALVGTRNVMAFLQEQLLSAIRKWHTRTSLRGINSGALERMRKAVQTASVPERSVVKKLEAPAPPMAPAASGSLEAPEVVVIGSSTGGPNALRDVLCSLPPSLPVPILMVQHMPAQFTGFLAARLDEQCSFQVREAEDGETVSAKQVLIARGGQHLKLCRRGNRIVVQLTDDAPVRSCRPAVDVLFQSAADVYGARTLGVVLTGMGSDGTDGCRRIKEAGGNVIVQDRETCVVWGMPRSVEEARLADAVVPLQEIGSRIHQRLRRQASENSQAAPATSLVVSK